MRTQNIRKLHDVYEREYRYIMKYKALLISIGTHIVETSLQYLTVTKSWH